LSLDDCRVVGGLRWLVPRCSGRLSRGGWVGGRQREDLQGWSMLSRRPRSPQSEHARSTLKNTQLFLKQLLTIALVHLQPSNMKQRLPMDHQKLALLGIKDRNLAELEAGCGHHSLQRTDDTLTDDPSTPKKDTINSMRTIPTVTLSIWNQQPM
jgi:hypothetical protein